MSKNILPVPNCTWLTYYPDTLDCHLFTDCPSLDSHDCYGCKSSKFDCLPDDPICLVKGLCLGTEIQKEKISTVEECLQLCDELDRCRWFSHYAFASECTLLEVRFGIVRLGYVKLGYVKLG